MAIHSAIRAMYKYFNETTFKMKYLKGAIDESGSIVFNIVCIFYSNLKPAKSNTAINVEIELNIVVYVMFE